MIGRVSKLRCLTRCYGFEDMSEKWTKNWWMYAKSDHFGDLTPEERGYQMAIYDKDINEEWKQKPAIVWQVDLNDQGRAPSKILDAELATDNPIGPYDPMDQTLAHTEIKTRIIHILKHFEKLDLRTLDWGASILDKLKFDEFERIAFLTSVEAEFKTVFEDNVFDNIKKLDDIVDYLATDRYAL
jgi:acyl carrier protein